jgi:putative ABC transport system ATP-binding protein
MEPLLSMDRLSFSWPKSEQPLLRIENLALEASERVFLRGPSGSGKSTLLSLIAGILQPTSGSLSMLGTDLTQLSGPQRDRFRADHIGYIFQMFNLVPYLSVVDNVLLACRFSARRRQRALERSSTLEAEARRLLSHLNLPEELQYRSPYELSIGQQQRVAAARAFIGAPDLMIADEPTSALDADARAAFIQLLFDECQASNMTLLFVSHDQSLADYFDCAVDLPTLNRAGERR